MTLSNSGLTIRKYGLGSKFVADPETAALLASGASVNFAAFTDAKYGAAGARAVPGGTVVTIGRSGLVEPYAALASNPTASAFAATTAYTAGQFVRPTTPNGYTYQVTTAGTSGGSEPTWPTDASSTVISGGVTFTETPLSGSVTTWQASHTYHTGQFVQPSSPNGHTYVVSDGGTSSATEPTWPTIEAASVSDGSVVFTDAPAPTVLDDTGTAYIMASDVIEPGGSFFLTSGQGTTGLYASGVFFEDLMPDADPATHTIASSLKTALGPTFRFTKSMSILEHNDD